MRTLYLTHESLLDVPKDVMQEVLYPIAYLPDDENDVKFLKAFGFIEPILQSWVTNPELVESGHYPTCLPPFLRERIDPIGNVKNLMSIEVYGIVIVNSDGQTISPSALFDLFKHFQDVNPRPEDMTFPGNTHVFGDLDYYRDSDRFLAHYGSPSDFLKAMGRVYKDAPAVREAVSIRS